MPHVGDPGGDVPLRGHEAGHAPLGGKGGNVAAGDLPLHDRKGGDHLVVGLGHVARPGRTGDLGVVQLRGVLVHVGQLEADAGQGLEGQGRGDGLGRGPRSHAVLADAVQAQDRRLPVVRRQQQGEAADAVFQGRQALLDVVAGVHVELGHRAAAEHHHVGAHAAGHHAGRGDDRGHRAGAEPAHVEAAGVDAFGDLGHGLGHVAAAALQGVAHRLLGALHHEVHVSRAMPHS